MATARAAKGTTAGGSLRTGAGVRVVLGERLGGGGEGAVYAVQGRPDTVAKIYREALSRERREKLEAMIGAAPPALAEVTAWPSELLHADGGAVGFLMPRAVQAEEAHVLYGPKSRKQRFPHAGYRFLVHAAMNLARAFAVVHRAGVVIGDVNERVAMIAQNGTVRLIDCDSFQIRSGGRTFACEVGVPLFTPPELQAVPSFRGLERTEQHDLFGLAVLIFHLLFLGRHPFSGRNSDRPDMTIETAIREHRFAYGLDRRRTAVAPPANAPPLQSAGDDVARLLEAAFAPAASLGTARRPAAAQWADALERLLATLATCSGNGAHAYASSLPACPWCAIELTAGVELFNYVEPAGSAGPPLDVEAVWRAIEAMPVLAPSAVPDPNEIRHRLAPSPDAVRLRAARDAQDRLAQAAAARAAAEQEAQAQERAVATAEAAVTEARAFLAAFDVETARLPELTRRHALSVGIVRRYRWTDYALLAVAAAALLYARDPARPGAIAVLVGSIAALIAVGGASLGPEWRARRLAQELARLRASLALDPGQRRQQLRGAEQAAETARQDLIAARGKVYGAMLAQTGAKAQAGEPPVDVARLRAAIEARHRSAATRFNDALARHRAFEAELQRLRPQLTARRDEALAVCAEIRRLEARRKAELRKARGEAREGQLGDYLDGFFIMHESWPRQLPKAVLAALSSFGIETAADITQDAVAKVPGFGKVRTQMLLDWRRRKAASFRFDASETAHAAKLQAVDRRLDAERRQQERLLRKANARLEALAAAPAQRHAAIAAELADAARGLAQALTDMEAMPAAGPAGRQPGVGGRRRRRSAPRAPVCGDVCAEPGRSADDRARWCQTRRV